MCRYEIFYVFYQKYCVDKFLLDCNFMYNDRVFICILRFVNVDFKYLLCEIFWLFVMILEGFRDRGKILLVLNKVVDIGLCKCCSYNWRIQNEVVKVM